MFSYLHPRKGPVFDGLEDKEVVYAKEQPQYIPLRTLTSVGPDRKVYSRWTLTDDQRARVADGYDIFLELSTFGHPLQPIRMAIGSGNESSDWIKICLLDETVGVKV